MIGRYRSRKNYQFGGGGDAGPVPSGVAAIMAVEYNMPTAWYRSDTSLINSVGLTPGDLGVGEYPELPRTRPARIASWNIKPWQLIVNGTWGNQTVPTFILWEHTIEVLGGNALGEGNRWGAALTPTTGVLFDIYTSFGGSIYRGEVGNVYILNGHRDGLMATFRDGFDGRVTSNLGYAAQTMDITQFSSMGVAAIPAPSDWVRAREGLVFLGEDEFHWASTSPASYDGTITAYSAYPVTFEKIGELE